jgi:hypothetical protein
VKCCPAIRGNLLLVVATLALTSAVWTQAQQAPVEPRDALTRLNERLDSGVSSLDYRDRFGYLPSLLKQLNVDVDSQVLVFSKTSLQQAIITPQNPRALYFNDEVAVGYVPGGEVYELVSLEPSSGLVFYTLDTHRVDAPRLRRRGTECFFCHGLGNKGAPSLVVATVLPDAHGNPAYTSTFINTIDHRTPFSQRWGGWYVTGTHGAQTHLGNAIAEDPLRPLDLDSSHSQNLTTLEGRFDLSKYLLGSSDIVALMTLEHQVGVVNRINATAVEYRTLNRDGLTDADWTQLDADIDDLVRYMLFVDEAPLTAPITGVSGFTQTFSRRGPRDSMGRSLRDFDLKTRTFRYPLSYMIYTRLFDSQPPPILERVYRRLYDVLSGVESSPSYAPLSAADRQAIREILLETKHGLPAYWSAPVRIQ